MKLKTSLQWRLNQMFGTFCEWDFVPAATVAIKIDNCLPFTCWFSNLIPRSINLRKIFTTPKRKAKTNKFPEKLFINNPSEKIPRQMRRNLIKKKILKIILCEGGEKEKLARRFWPMQVFPWILSHHEALSATLRDITLTVLVKCFGNWKFLRWNLCKKRMFSSRLNAILKQGIRTFELFTFPKFLFQINFSLRTIFAYCLYEQADDAKFHVATH